MNIKKLFFRSLAVAAILMLAFLVASEVTDATTTKTGSSVSRLGFPNWLRFTHTWVAATDTIYCPFTLAPVSGGGNPEVPATFLIYTKGWAASQGDSLSIRVTLETSSDGTAYDSVRIGVDSTTWTENAGSWKLNVFNMSRYLGAENGLGHAYGYRPYARLRIAPYYATGAGPVTYNHAGNFVRVDVIVN